MNHGMFNQIRDYLTSIDSRLGQLIAEQKRTNELLAGQGNNTPQEAQLDPADVEPWKDYDDLTAARVVEHLSIKLLSDEELAHVRTYEIANKNRSTVIKALESIGN